MGKEKRVKLHKEGKEIERKKRVKLHKKQGIGMIEIHNI